MDVTCSHSKNPALGWDISAAAKTAAGEKIARAQVYVNDMLKYDKSFNPPLSSWQEQLPQQGEYPGDNETLVVITDENDQETECLDSWS